MEEIERGFNLLIEKVEKLNEEKGELSGKVRKNDAALLGRMAAISVPVIKRIGLNMLEKGKQDSKGELFNTSFYPFKMIVLGKGEPLAHRPDDANKTVTDQFCLLGEDGKFYELMYSSDGMQVDSYLHSLEPAEVLAIYNYDIMFMLYRAMRDYLEGEEGVLEALRITLEFIFPTVEK
jgi:hypothetical protein